MRWRESSVVMLVLLLAAATPSARAGVAPAESLDQNVLAIGGVAMAPDGGGAIAYLRPDGGVPHAFVSLLGGGAWAAPVRVDPGLAAAAQPVVATAAGGRVAVAFTSGGALYASVRTTRGGAFTAPQEVASAASDPALSMGASGTAYVAYGAPGGAVGVARLDRTATTFETLPGPLTPTAAAGAATGPQNRASIAVSADATGIVAWAQAGGDGRTHVYARRVYGLHLGSVLTDVTLDQLGGVAASGGADTPDVGIQDDSSFAWIAFRQSFGGTQRALARELVGSALGDPEPLDGLGTPPGENAAAPSLAIDGVGDGLAATQLTGSGNAIGAAIGASGGFGAPAQINQLAAAPAPAPVSSVSRDGQGLVAFATAAGTVEARLYDAGAAAGESTLSTPGYGPVVPGGGLGAASDAKGDTIVGFLQGTPGADRLVAAAAVNPPGYFAGLTTDHFIRFVRPTFSWTPSHSAFSTVTYTVQVDGMPIGTTQATTLQSPTPLADGVHRWQAIARDSLGQQTSSALRTLRIAARPPVVALRLTGSRHAHRALDFAVAATSAAGIARIQLAFGDGARATGARTRHAYAKAGHPTVTVTVVDRAGNRAVLRRGLAIGG